MAKESDWDRGFQDGQKAAKEWSDRGDTMRKVTKALRPFTDYAQSIGESNEYMRGFQKSRNELANETMRNKPASYKNPKPYKCGGAVKKMANGGSVCRGGGAATRGTKFSGVK